MGPRNRSRSSPSWAAFAVLAAGAALIASGIFVGPPTAQQAPARPSDRPPAPRPDPFARIPKVDIHVHVDPASAPQVLRIMEDQGISVAFNASGGEPGGDFDAWARIASSTKGRLRSYCNLSWSRVERPGWAEYWDRTLRTCAQRGAVGLKIFKSLGLGVVLRDGALLRVDDPRLDGAFELAGQLRLPVLIHTGDPQAFFRPPTPENERYAELRAHPGWSFFGLRPDGNKRWPPWAALFEQYEARVARHPHTIFVGAHFGNAAEEPPRVGRMLERYPNLVIETGARVPEMGRYPASGMKRLFTRYQDRILFGSDLAVTKRGLTLGSRGAQPDSPQEVPRFFEAHWRYFETEARGLAHPTPIQGSWRVDGIGLPTAVLEKFYRKNAIRVFGLEED